MIWKVLGISNQSVNKVIVYAVLLGDPLQALCEQWGSGLKGKQLHVCCRHGLEECKRGIHDGRAREGDDAPSGETRPNSSCKLPGKLEVFGFNYTYESQCGSNLSIIAGGIVAPKQSVAQHRGKQGFTDPELATHQDKGVGARADAGL
jgi:hypothetical protein